MSKYDKDKVDEELIEMTLMQGEYKKKKSQKEDKIPEILVDYREGDRWNKTLRYFGMDRCQKASLKYGDFAYKGNIVGIEFKTGEDFLNSISDRRVFRQAVDLTKNFKHPFVIIATEDIQKDIDKLNAIFRSRTGYNKLKYTTNQFYGAVASLCTMLNVLLVKDFNEALHMMEYLFEKCSDGKRRDILPPEYKNRNPCITYLAGIYGVNVTMASKISRELGLTNLEEMLTVKERELLKIRGIGKKTAKNIMEAIK